LGLYSKSAFWLGIAIAVGAIISSFSVKYILPYLSEFVFRKIGYGAMVLSGITLLELLHTDYQHFIFFITT
jgi:hypothetical protein